MTVEEIILIRQALTYSVAILEIRLEDATEGSLFEDLTQGHLDTAKKAYQAALRLS